MLSENLRILRQLYPRLARWEALRAELRKQVVEFKLHPFDLNPHVSIRRLAKDVALNVEASGFKCSTEDVLLFWLTMKLTDQEV